MSCVYFLHCTFVYSSSLWCSRGNSAHLVSHHHTYCVGPTSTQQIPKITKQPQSQVVEAGDPLTLTCEAVSFTDLTYLWYFNGLSLKGETRSEYSINCFTDEDEGMYQCAVANSMGRVTSDMVEVKMKAIDWMPYLTIMDLYIFICVCLCWCVCWLHWYVASCTFLPAGHVQCNWI